MCINSWMPKALALFQRKKVLPHKKQKTVPAILAPTAKSSQLVKLVCLSSAVRLYFIHTFSYLNNSAFCQACVMYRLQTQAPFPAKFPATFTISLHTCREQAAQLPQLSLTGGTRGSTALPSSALHVLHSQHTTQHTESRWALTAAQ